MDWPEPRGGGSGLAIWPTVAWRLRRAWGQRRFRHKSERCPCGAGILLYAAPPVFTRTWGTNEVLRCSKPPWRGITLTSGRLPLLGIQK
jgi:hypothetical protein